MDSQVVAKNGHKSADKEATQNRPLGKTRKSGSKFDLQQDSSTVLYRPEFKYDTSKKGTDKMWELMSSYLGTDRAAIQR